MTVSKKEKGTASSTLDSVKNQLQGNQKNGIIEVSDLEKDFVKQGVNTKNPTTKELLQRAEIDPYKTIETPPSILSIDDISFGTLGNFSCLTGKPKSRKTFFLSLLVAAALDHKGNNQRIKTEIPNTPVLHFDTEQSEYHTQLVARRIIELLELEEEGEKVDYKCYCLRPHESQTRIDIIEEAIYNTPNLKLVVIDGVADLIVGYNEEKEALRVISKFMKWTHELNIHIITIVHQNKGDNNAKGHLGSFILQKAETVLSIERDRDISIVTTSHSRGIEIEPLSFSLDENALPQLVDYTPNSNTISRKKRKPRDFEKDIHISILKDVFKSQSELSGADFSRFLKDVLEKHSVSIGNTAVRDWKTFYESTEMIIREDQQKPFKLSRLVSQSDVYTP